MAFNQVMKLKPPLGTGKFKNSVEQMYLILKCFPKKCLEDTFKGFEVLANLISIYMTR